MAQPRALLAGRYRLVRQVGRGGMGTVWQAWDERLERQVAVKELHAQIGVPADEAELAKQRAMREARITARLQHRNAVPVFDVVEHEGRPCLVMQFVSCVPLSAVLRERGPLEVPEVARTGAQVASALAAAHRLGIVHRDVKPGNVLVTDDGTALISDFGISHALGDATLTNTGLVHGTPAYLAPEVARGASSSYASDVFSLGATLYAALEGSPPFGTDVNSIALLYRVASGEHPPPRRAGPLTALLVAMLQADPGARPSMGEAAARLAGASTADDGAGAAAPPPVAPTRSGGVLPPDDPTPRTRVAGPPTFAAPAPAARADPGVPAVAGAGAQVARKAPGRPRRRAWPIVVLVLVISLAAVGVVVLAGGLGSRTEGSGSSATPSSPSSPSSATSPSSSSSPESTPEPTPTPTPSSTLSSAAGEPTAAELSDALTGYYALLPAGTDEAWPRLTARFQRDKAQGRSAFDRFWGGIDEVSASEVQARPPSRVDATITYRRGTTVTVERTSFRFVREDGVLKISDSSVLGR